MIYQLSDSLFYNFFAPEFDYCQYAPGYWMSPPATRLKFVALIGDCRLQTGPEIISFEFFVSDKSDSTEINLELWLQFNSECFKLQVPLLIIQTPHLEVQNLSTKLISRV